jgi:hypothetical protein
VALTVLFQSVKKQQTEQDGKLYRFLLLAGLLTGRNFDSDSNVVSWIWLPSSNSVVGHITKSLTYS